MQAYSNMQPSSFSNIWSILTCS